MPETIESKRKLLEDIIEHIRFTDMTPEEFTIHVSEIGLLTAEEVKTFRQICKKRPFPQGTAQSNLFGAGFGGNDYFDCYGVKRNKTGY